MANFLGILREVFRPTPREANGDSQHRSLRSDKRGGVTIWFSISLPLLAMAVGAAVDYNNEAVYGRQLQAAVDSAALAGAVAQSNGLDAVATAKQYLANNFVAPPNNAISSTVTVDTTTSVVKVAASGSVPTYIMGLVGYRALPINAHAGATTGATGPTEVAIVFDTTYSMSALSSNGLTKLANAQADAVALVQKLFTLPNGAQNPFVKVGLVPFGVYVNIKNAAVQSLTAQGMTSSAALAALTPSTVSHPALNQFGSAPNALPWLTNTATNTTYNQACWENYGTWTCTNAGWVSQTCYNDGVPYDCSYQSQSCSAPDLHTQSCSQDWWGYGWGGCVATTPGNGDLTDTLTSSNPAWGVLNYNCASPMQRLTTDVSGLIAQINSLTANDDTYIPEGLIWGWRTLSPNAPFGDGAAYNSGTKKILILMTDGYNTQQPNPNLQYPWSSWAQYGPGGYYNNQGNDGTADATLRTTCANVVNSGITVFTIAFEVNNPNIQSILMNCATTPTHYYNATDIVSLSGAFQSIAGSLTQAHLTQ